ncbi:MAG: hypothetical protein RMK75_03175 [Aquificaceae bacterium]|nr:hypothetical protein [Aquificaceae bacterium]MDW8423308.1 hypothetical protein [Aquificaceae bacterium]
MTWDAQTLPLELWIFLLAFAILLLAYAIHEHIRQRLDFYRALGARITGYHQLINPKAEIYLEGLRFEIFTSGPRGLHSLKVKTQVEPLAYLSLRKRDFLDRLTFQKSYEGLSLDYEDEKWAHKLLEHGEFKNLIMKLFVEARVDFLEIRNREVLAGWYVKNSLKSMDEDKVTKALEILKDVLETLRSFPSAELYKANLRDWMSLKLPLIFGALGTVFGVAGGFYKYKPVCLVEMLLVGFVVLSPLFSLYLALSVFLVGHGTTKQRVVLKTLFYCLISCFFLSLFFLPYVNGRLDSSEPVQKLDRIESKERGFRHGPRVILEEFHKQKPLCEGFTVSEDFYKGAYRGAKVEYWIKKGFLGVEWLYEGLKIVE